VGYLPSQVTSRWEGPRVPASPGTARNCLLDQITFVPCSSLGGGCRCLWWLSMFVVELAFGSDPERLAARPAHRDTLLRLHLTGAVRMAGPFHDDTGALLVFDVETRPAWRD
jgi:hypothetical protein